MFLKMKIFAKYRCFLFVFFLIPGISFSQSDKAKALTSYIDKFASYTTWPNEDQIDSFRIVVITDNKDVVKEFHDFFKKQKIKKKPVSLLTQPSYVVRPSYVIRRNPQIIFLTAGKSGFIPNVYNEIEGLPVLLVSENYDEKRNIMINLYKTSQGNVLFEVNKANILNQNLAIDPEMLLGGGTEVDVANLYRKSQLSLRNMQKEMNKMTDSFNMLEKNIEISINQIKTKQKEISAQKELLASTLDKLDEDKKRIATHDIILKAQKDSILIKNNILHNQLNEIKKQWEDIENQENVLKSKQKQIEDLNTKIESRNEEIENKKIELKSKNEDIESQLLIISRQKNTMFLLMIISVLVVSLGVSILINYRKNRQKREILAYQKREIEERLDEVNHLNIQLKNADQYKSIFLASMSHELRTPLNSIIGYTGILLMGMTGDLNDEQSKQLAKVKNNALHLLSLINDILDISKIEADRIELVIEEFKLKKLIDEVIETLFPKANEKNLELTSTIDENVIITTDYRRLKQVFLNLVTNAVNCTNTGKIEIFSKYMADNKLKISVKDTGIGISKADIPRLFQPFHQIDSSLTKKNSSGTGLGLYLCRKIIHVLGGEVSLSSSLDIGSEFILEIPLKID